MGNQSKFGRCGALPLPFTVFSRPPRSGSMLMAARNCGLRPRWGLQQGSPRQ